MKVGLIQLDGKLPNLALMKLSKFHTDKGDDVTIIDLSNFKFDRTYASKIFVGGPGYSLKSKLLEEIELLTPDYERFKIDYSIGFTTRGCIRNCEFCIVRGKEGELKDVNYGWIKHQKVLLLDNNFLASPNCEEKLKYFIDNNLKVCFNQGLDIRLVTNKVANPLSLVRFYDLKFKAPRLYFSWDTMDIEKSVIKGIKTLNKAGIQFKYLMFYMLVGYNTTFEQDMYRFKVLDNFGCLPYIMIYNNRRDKPILRHFARWVNKRYYNWVKWEDYLKNKGKIKNKVQSESLEDF